MATNAQASAAEENANKTTYVRLSDAAHDALSERSSGGFSRAAQIRDAVDLYIGMAPHLPRLMEQARKEGRVPSWVAARAIEVYLDAKDAA